MSEEDKSLYLEIIQSATETRYYIRIVIIGENRVGKTCLLRRLLGESIDDVESTDGIDIVHRCKIRLHDGQWIISEETNKKKDLITRIKMVVNAKASDDVNMEYKESSQSSITQLPQNSQKWPGTSKEVRPTVINRKSLEDKLESTEPILPNTDDKGRGNNDESVLTRVESKRSLSQSKKFKITEQKIKPTLEKVLTESILNQLSQFINDIDKFDIPNEIFVDCGFWDFAGQRYYYPTHQIFLNRNAVHLLVADIMKDLKQISTEVGYDKIGEYIDFWFDSIHSCGAVEAMNDSPGDHLNPSVIVVCTGIDKCQDKLDERKNEFRKQIMSLLGEEEKQKHLRRICCLSNTEPSQKDFDYLRQSIFEFGKKIETFGEKLPLRWIRLEKTLDILYEAGINILSWPDMADLASKCSIDDDNEVSLFLKYHHKIGTIIYFESVKEFIILNQKWLADAFRCFVSDKYDNDLKLTPEWKTLEDTGELKPTLIKKLFQKETKHEFCRHEDHLLKVMEMFGVIVRVSALNEYGQKQSLPIFYMPCMISDKTSIGQIYDMFGVKRDTCKQTPWLCIQFEFMPFDFFNHIFCHYIRQYPVCVEAKTRRMTIYHGMGVFVLDKSRKFVLCFSKNVIALQIWQWKKLDKGKCKAMLKELRSVISNVKNKYEPRKVMYTVKTKCANGNIHDAVGRLSYTELLNEVEEGDEGYLCGEHHEFHDTRDLFETWFEDYSEGLVGVAGLPIEMDRASEPSARDISGKQMEIGLVGVADVPVEADRDSKPSSPDPSVDPGSQQETNEVCEPESWKSEDPSTSNVAKECLTRDQKQQINLLLQDLEKRLTEWIPLTRGVIRKLRKLANDLNEHFRMISIAKVAGSNGAIVGGILSVIGVILIPFTYGESLRLSIAGGVLAGAGSVTVGGSMVADAVLSGNKQKETEALFKTHANCIDDVKDKCILIGTSLAQYGKLEECFPEWVTFWEKVVECQETKDAKWNSIAEILKSNLDFSAAFLRVGLTAGASRIVGAATALHIVDGIAGALFIPLDIYTLVDSAIDIHKKNPHKSAATISSYADYLETLCPKTEDVAEMIKQTKSKLS